MISLLQHDHSRRVLVSASRADTVGKSLFLLMWREFYKGRYSYTVDISSTLISACRINSFYPPLATFLEFSLLVEFKVFETSYYLKLMKNAEALYHIVMVHGDSQPCALSQWYGGHLGKGRVLNQIR